ncbi:MAG: NRDE family protein [Bacillota bacterium]
MCLIVVAWRARHDLPLAVAANRDEWRERAAQPAHWWPDHPLLLAGRDLRAGGTWMGVTRNGRFAAVTNFRDPSDKRSTALSRGMLVTDFLLGADSPREYLERLAAHVREYNGFNLVLGDGDALFYFGSREGVPREIEPGIHGLSNHVLDEPWPKVIRGRQVMTGAMKDDEPQERLFELLSDDDGAPDEDLPDTGVGLDWERRLAAPLIVGDDYGTRASTVLTISERGEVFFEERTRTASGLVADISQYRFTVRAAARIS